MAMWTVVLFSALVATASIVDAANHTITATPTTIEPGVSPALVLTCTIQPDNSMPYITSLVLSFTPGAGNAASTTGGAASSTSSPSTAAPATPAPTTKNSFVFVPGGATTKNPLVFNPLAPTHAGLPIFNLLTTTTTTKSPTTTTTTPKPTTTTQPATTATPASVSTKPANLASVFAFSAQVLPTSPVKGTVTGNIDATGLSSLEFTITNPDASNVGVYACKANGFNSFGMPESATEDVTVTSQTSQPKDVAAKVAHLDVLQQQILKDVQELKDRWAYVDNSSVFFHSPPHGDRKYLLAKSGVEHVNMCQFICTVQGGYLAEINDQAEFDFVQSFVSQHLSGVPDYPDVLLGASDEAHPGKWTFLQNPGDLVFTKWGNSPPSGYHCLGLAEHNGFFMNDYRCAGYNRFICEIHV